MRIGAPESCRLPITQFGSGVGRFRQLPRNVARLYSMMYGLVYRCVGSTPVSVRSVHASPVWMHRPLYPHPASMIGLPGANPKRTSTPMGAIPTGADSRMPSTMSTPANGTETNCWK